MKFSNGLFESDWVSWTGIGVRISASINSEFYLYFFCESTKTFNRNSETHRRKKLIQAIINILFIAHKILSKLTEKMLISKTRNNHLISCDKEPFNLKIYSESNLNWIVLLTNINFVNLVKFFPWYVGRNYIRIYPELGRFKLLVEFICFFGGKLISYEIVI